MARYRIKLTPEAREAAAAASTTRRLANHARKEIDRTFPGFDPAREFEVPGAHASLHFMAFGLEFYCYPDDATTWLVGLCVPYQPQPLVPVKDIRPTQAVLDVMKRYGWSWTMMDWHTRLALNRCEEVDYPCTEFPVPVVQQWFYTWPIGASDAVSLDVYEFEPKMEITRPNVVPLRRRQ
jgi:hypothetical protein